MIDPTYFKAMSDKIRFYYHDGKRYPSVTSIIKGGIPTPSLERWKRNQVIERAADNRKMLATLTKAKAMEFLKEEDDTVRGAAADFGSGIHSFIEASIKGWDLPSLDEDSARVIGQFERFNAEYQPVWLDSEFSCFSDKYGYAGTADAIVRIAGTEYILDFKTGKRIYPEVALQLSAYDNSDFIRSKEGTTRSTIRLGRGLALQLRPDMYELSLIDIGKDTFDTFLSCLDIFNWSHVQSDHVVRGVLGHDE
jgi:hypothetical protein